jgi:hypothetical protein
MYAAQASSEFAGLNSQARSMFGSFIMLRAVEINNWQIPAEILAGVFSSET